MTTDSKPTTTPKPARKRILELDALRAISCLNLLLFHFTYVYANKYGFESPLGFSFPYGKYGVQLFFMLSGFVNAMTLVGKRSAQDFLAARCIRIFPSYWLVILMNVVLFSYIPFFHTTPTLDATVANLTTMPNLFGYTNMEPVTWTLQVEMFFYAFLIIMTLTNGFAKPLKVFGTIMAVSAVCCLGFTAFKSAYPASSWNTAFHVAESMFIMRNFPLFVMGMLLNEIACKRGVMWHNILGILGAAFVFHLIDLRDHNPAATALLFGLLTFCAYGKMPLLRFKPLLFISSISYTLYLFHNNVGSACIGSLESLGLGSVLSVIVATGLTIALGTAVTIWFEGPITKFLNQKWRNRKQPKTTHVDPVSPNMIKN
jgi:peptidoglycan/LPS O-acetylase OafA/YrhL